MSFNDYQNYDNLPETIARRANEEERGYATSAQTIIEFFRSIQEKDEGMLIGQKVFKALMADENVGNLHRGDAEKSDARKEAARQVAKQAWVEVFMLEQESLAPFTVRRNTDLIIKTIRDEVGDRSFARVSERVTQIQASSTQ
jgi:hypothetical protein